MPFLDGMLQWMSQNKVTVLAFHKVPRLHDLMAPEEPSVVEFERTIKFVAEKFKVLSLEEAIAGLASGSLSKGGVCLTFDDGYPEWLELVVPILQKYKFPATFFITTGQLDGVPLWHERVRYALHEPASACIDLTDPALRKRVNCNSIVSRIRAARTFEQFLKLKTVEVRDELIFRLENDLKVDLALVPRITENQILEIHRLGFEIGAHSVNHPILTKCTAPQARAEIVDSKERLESIVAGKIRYFAYPNGRNTDFDQIHTSVVEECGYEAALTTEGGAWSSDNNLYRIPRFTPWGPTAGRIFWQLAKNLI